MTLFSIFNEFILKIVFRLPFCILFISSFDHVLLHFQFYIWVYGACGWIWVFLWEMGVVVCRMLFRVYRSQGGNLPSFIWHTNRFTLCELAYC